MLSIEEERFFNKVVSSVVSNLNISIPIIPYDHELLEGKSKNALGCSWSYDKNAVYQITIDEFYIKECYHDYLWKQGVRGKDIFPKIEQSLEETLFHEISHIAYWRHGKKHEELAQRLYMDYKNRINKESVKESMHITS